MFNHFRCANRSCLWFQLFSFVVQDRYDPKHPQDSRTWHFWPTQDRATKSKTIKVPNIHKTNQSLHLPICPSALRGEKGLRHQRANVQHQPQPSCIKAKQQRGAPPRPWRKEDQPIVQGNGCQHHGLARKTIHRHSIGKQTFVRQKRTKSRSFKNVEILKGSCVCTGVHRFVCRFSRGELPARLQQHLEGWPAVGQFIQHLTWADADGERTPTRAMGQVKIMRDHLEIWFFVSN